MWKLEEILGKLGNSSLQKFAQRETKQPAACVLDLLATYDDDSDGGAGSDASLPAGLSFSPSEGQLTCLVYVPVPSAAAALLARHAAFSWRLLGLRGGGGDGACLTTAPTFHVSLSRPFPLRAHCVAPFSARLAAALAARRAAPAPLPLRGLRVFCNSAGTAAFPALLAGGPALPTLLAAADDAAAAFGLAPFYRPPRPHASLGEARGAIAVSALLAAAAGMGVEVFGGAAARGGGGGGGSKGARAEGATPVDVLFEPPAGARKRACIRESEAAATVGTEGGEGNKGGAEGGEQGEEPPPCTLNASAVCFKAGGTVFTLILGAR